MTVTWSISITSGFYGIVGVAIMLSLWCHVSLHFFLKISFQVVLSPDTWGFDLRRTCVQWRSVSGHFFDLLLGDLHLDSGAAACHFPICGDVYGTFGHVLCISRFKLFFWFGEFALEPLGFQTFLPMPSEICELHRLPYFVVLCRVSSCQGAGLVLPDEGKRRQFLVAVQRLWPSARELVEKHICCK